MEVLILVIAVIAIFSTIQWIRYQKISSNYKDFLDTVTETSIENKEEALNFVQNLCSYNYKKTDVALRQQEANFDEVLEDIHDRVTHTVSNYTDTVNGLLNVINSFSEIKSKKVSQMCQDTNAQVLLAVSRYKDISKIWEGMFEIKEGRK